MYVHTYVAPSILQPVVCISLQVAQKGTNKRKKKKKKNQKSTEANSAVSRCKGTGWGNLAGCTGPAQ